MIPAQVPEYTEIDPRFLPHITERQGAKKLLSVVLHYKRGTMDPFRQMCIFKLQKSRPYPTLRDISK